MVTQTTKTVKEHIAEIQVTISYLDKQIRNIEISHSKTCSEIQELRNTLQKIKEEFADKKDVQEIESLLEGLKSKISGFEMELPELRLVKKITLGMVAFVLTAFLGLVWNAALMTKKPDPVDEIAKKIAEEYKKNATQR